MPTISKGRTPLTLINVFTVTPDKQDELIELLKDVTEQTVRHHQGFVSASLHRGIDGKKVTMYAQWASVEDYNAMRQNPGPSPSLKKSLKIAPFDPGICQASEGRSRRTMDPGPVRRHRKLGPGLTRAWQEMEQITIGAIEGFCVGGGVALAVALDFRVIGRDAHLRVPEIGLGMNMSWQSIPRMLRLIGPARTKQAVILADQPISAAEAYEWGLVEEVADPGQAFERATTLPAKVAE